MYIKIKVLNFAQGMILRGLRFIIHLDKLHYNITLEENSIAMSEWIRMLEALRDEKDCTIESDEMTFRYEPVTGRFIIISSTSMIYLNKSLIINELTRAIILMNQVNDDLVSAINDEITLFNNSYVKLYMKITDGDDENELTFKFKYDDFIITMDIKTLLKRKAFKKLLAKSIKNNMPFVSNYAGCKIDYAVNSNDLFFENYDAILSCNVEDL